MLPSNGKRELMIMTGEVVYTKCLPFKWLVIVRTLLLGNRNVVTCQRLENTEANVNNLAR